MHDDMTHSYVWRDSFICVPWPSHMCNTTHPYVWRGESIRVIWLIHMCDMTHSAGFSRMLTPSCSVWQQNHVFWECLHRVAHTVHRFAQHHLPYHRLAAYGRQNHTFRECSHWVEHAVYLSTELQRMADKTTFFENVYIELHTLCTEVHMCLSTRLHTPCVWERERKTKEREKDENEGLRTNLHKPCTISFTLFSLSLSVSLFLSSSFPSVFFSLSFSLALSFSLSPFLSRPRECVNTCSYVWHDSLVGTSHRPWAPKCTHSAYFTWHDLFVWITWLIVMYEMTHLYVWHDSFTCVTRLIYMCDTTHLYVWHDSFICVTWLIHVCDKSHSYMCHILFFISVTVKTHLYMWHDSSTCVTWRLRMSTGHKAWAPNCRHNAHFPCRTWKPHPVSHRSTD